MYRIPILVIAAAAFAGSALAQHQPYAGLQTRPVKALSDEQIADLKAGRGMGLALAAELNGYPGPSHVIELADKLALSAAQRARVKELFEAMKAETIPLGERLIEQEQHLDTLFAKKVVTPASLETATAAIGSTQGALRAAHLKYHLTMQAELSPEQLTRYSELRGYAGAGHGGRAHGVH
jgi:hypothetical protein